MIPGARLLRRLVLTGVVLGTLFVGANVFAERLAENKVAEAVQKEFDLSQKPVIDISGFPILLSVLRGTLPRITFDARDVTVEGLRIRLVRVRLDEITADGLLSGNVAVTVGNGTVVAEVDDAALNALLKKQNKRATVKLRDGNAATVVAVRRILGRDRRIVASGTVTYARGTLIFTPRRVKIDGETPPAGIEAIARRESTVKVKLPELPGGVAVDSVETHAGFARLVASLRGQRFGTD